MLIRVLAVAGIIATFSCTQSASAAEVIDGDTLIVGGTTYRLHGIDTPEAGQKCNRPGGGTWRCGNEATDALVAMVRNKTVLCDNRGKDDYDRTIAVCNADGTELNSALVEAGLAWAFRKFSNDYIKAEAAARAMQIGIWRAPTETAEEYRARRWHVAKQQAPEGCPIKGNISRNGRIYHTPWSPWYDRTKLSVSKGERWFCSEREALNAGWRAPRWGKRD